MDFFPNGGVTQPGCKEAPIKNVWDSISKERTVFDGQFVKIFFHQKSLKIFYIPQASAASSVATTCALFFSTLRQSTRSVNKYLKTDKIFQIFSTFFNPRSLHRLPLRQLRGLHQWPVHRPVAGGAVRRSVLLKLELATKHSKSNRLSDSHGPRQSDRLSPTARSTASFSSILSSLSPLSPPFKQLI